MSTEVQPKPLLYIKRGCPWCIEAEDFLTKHKIPYDVVDVRGSSAAYQEMIELSGQERAPTMDWDGEVLADFGAAELEVFLKKKKII